MVLVRPCILTALTRPVAMPTPIPASLSAPPPFSARTATRNRARGLRTDLANTPLAQLPGAIGGGQSRIITVPLSSASRCHQVSSMRCPQHSTGGVTSPKKRGKRVKIFAVFQVPKWGKGGEEGGGVVE